jgi:hypothetical protein
VSHCLGSPPSNESVIDCPYSILGDIAGFQLVGREMNTSRETMFRPQQNQNVPSIQRRDCARAHIHASALAHGSLTDRAPARRRVRGWWVDANGSDISQAALPGGHAVGCGRKSGGDLGGRRGGVGMETWSGRRER